ncbi:hypothetical protein BGX31_000863 [Mortierella sp. GBA43]|nr:hypothetical protein BGX31_000863 [Mortierella sp. GBA43]
MSMSPVNASNESSNERPKETEYLGREPDMKLLDIHVEGLPDYQRRLLAMALGQAEELHK